MFRGYRRVLAALAGLILIGAGEPPKTDKQPQNSTPQNEATKPPSAKPPAISSGDKPAEKDTGCEKGNDRRNSDLCAQWKAADAALDAAKYSFWGLGIGVIGTIFLVATFWETRKTARAQIRAYVGVEPITLRINAATGEASVDLKILNNGSTPAFKTHWAGNVVISIDDKMERDLLVTPEPGKGVIPQGRAAKTAIHGQQFATATLYAHPDLNIDDIKAIIAGDKTLYVFGFVMYEDAFEISRLTKFCFASGEIPGPGETHKPGVDYQWVMPPFHNDAT
jgi:hypothetical protein